MSTWISIKKQLPQHDGLFVVAVGMPGKPQLTSTYAEYDAKDSLWLIESVFADGLEVYYWQPLPAPPDMSGNVASEQQIGYPMYRQRMRCLCGSPLVQITRGGITICRNPVYPHVAKGMLGLTHLEHKQMALELLQMHEQIAQLAPAMDTLSASVNEHVAMEERVLDELNTTIQYGLSLKEERDRMQTALQLLHDHFHCRLLPGTVDLGDTPEEVDRVFAAGHMPEADLLCVVCEALGIPYKPALYVRDWVSVETMLPPRSGRYSVIASEPGRAESTAVSTDAEYDADTQIWTLDSVLLPTLRVYSWKYE